VEGGWMVYQPAARDNGVDSLSGVSIHGLYGDVILGADGS